MNNKDIEKLAAISRSLKSSARQTAIFLENNTDFVSDDLDLPWDTIPFEEKYGVSTDTWVASRKIKEDARAPIETQEDVADAVETPNKLFDFEFFMMRNLLRAAVFRITYSRQLFAATCFEEKPFPAFEDNIMMLTRGNEESRRLIQSMQKGVCDALDKRYLKALSFCICEAVEGPMIEEYAFSVCYPSCRETEVTPDQMRSSACNVISTLIRLMGKLDAMPKERAILIKLLCDDDVTPVDYVPPFFKGCTEQDAECNLWQRNPLIMEAGNVSWRHFGLDLKVSSVLDFAVLDEDEDQVAPDARDKVHMYLKVPLNKEAAASREISVPGNDEGRANGNANASKIFMFEVSVREVVP